MTDEYPEFFLRLPNSGPTARGRLLGEKVAGSQKFVVTAGSPVRPTVVPSFQLRVPSSYYFREKLIEDGRITESRNWPGWLETTEDVECSSPSAAAEILVGRSANGWEEWRAEDDRPLSDFMSQVWWGPNRAWLVRGDRLAGPEDVRKRWLPEGIVSFSVVWLRPGVQQGSSKDQLRKVVAEDYDATAPYGQRAQLVEELHAFLSRMKPGDTVCAFEGERLYIGKVVGSVEEVRAGAHGEMRRPVEWQAGGVPAGELPEELQQKLTVPHGVVDLTAFRALIEGLGLTDEQLASEAEAMGATPGVEPPAVVARRELELPEFTDQVRQDLLVHEAAWLEEIREILLEERQLVFYGPPGTGKTHLALKLAEHLSGSPDRVKLVQFHPSYSYEDFFEGFRPREDQDSGEVAFRLTPGPLRELADLARDEMNRHLPYFLVIDEMNRANLAKVFGELYFLLEYRNRSVRLTYSEDDFALPPNLFVIGTMNTADRSIALVDAAMRRRFAFVELSPRIEPTKGLLARWLDSEGIAGEPAELLELLNARIDDADFLVGPSYLMKRNIHQDGVLERVWRTKILPLLEEHHYGEGLAVEETYGLRTLRAALTSGGRPGS